MSTAITTDLGVDALPGATFIFSPKTISIIKKRHFVGDRIFVNRHKINERVLIDRHKIGERTFVC
jgi:hypothetical protein